MNNPASAAQTLYDDLTAQGWRLWVEGELLRFRAPEGAAGPAVMRELKRHKPALVALLSEDAASQPIEKTHPASYGQQALWMVHQGAPDSPAYNVASAAWVESEVDFDALHAAWRMLVARHEALRTTFASERDGLRCVVHADPVIDASRHCCPDADGPALEARVREAYAEPFDLRQGPLARLRLLSIAPDRHVLLLAMHHIVFDAWSLWILHEELGELYAALAAGQTLALPTPQATFAQFAEWQHALPDSDEGKRQWDAWRARLEGATPGEPRWDRPRPAARTGRGATLHFHVAGEVADRVRGVAKAHGATPFMTLLAAFQAALHRQSGQKDFVVGATTSGRTKSQFAQVLGYFVNTLPIRAELKEDWSFDDLLRQTRERTLEALRSQDFPFALMVERLNPPREPGALPLCRVAFGLQKPHRFSQVADALNEDSAPIDWGGLRVRAFPLDQQEGQFDLVMELYEQSDGYRGLLKYDPQLMDDASAAQFAAHFETLLGLLLERSAAPMAAISLLSTPEQEQLLDWSRGAPVDSDAAPVIEAFERAARRTPRKTAIRCDDQSLTYAELNARAGRLARRLQRAGLRGRCVGCCLRRGPDTVIAQLALWKLGATYVPLDEGGPLDRLLTILDDCDAALVLTHAEVAGRLGVSGDPMWFAMDHACSVARDGAPRGDSDGDDAYVIYTSGSTGRPKGVRVSHGAFAQHVASAAAQFGTAESDVVLQFSGATFDPSLEQVWTALTKGAALEMRGPELWSAAEFWRRLDERGVSVANVPPAYFRECSDAAPTPLPASLRLVIVGGDAFPAALAAKWTGRGVRVLNAYGPTEIVVTATTSDLAEFDPARGRAPIGRPLPGRSAYVVDAHGRLAPIGVAGELWIAGPALAAGYLGDKSLTDRRFVADPIDPSARAYRTGDLARWNHLGQIEFLGRLDRQVKLHGYRVELGEVERALEALPAIRRAAMRVATDDAGDPVLVAYCVTAEGAATDESGTLTALRARLPGYMVPRQVEWLDELPTGSTGKVCVDRLPLRLRTAAAKRPDYVAPRCPTERVLAEAWAEVLGLEKVGVHDDFFELGGASLKSLRIVALAEEKGLTLPQAGLSPALLFEFPTIAQLAQRLAPGRTPHAEAPPEARAGGTKTDLSGYAVAQTPAARTSDV
ncbi:Linear gramicidin synthase subunit D [Pirellulimonas nuda]|uniref:Linear gramicidin synthase subunit D n=1 Tax=Pirellulimonas nuda TaxID=2528009 RepID=A0A518DIC8_9BACT|nr:non-ribosomal peptide synthetase [Pirellulimonas nuda]QDU91225.1 Linear gramicidin synthase subunit D [Pirellulimonas nuda]